MSLVERERGGQRQGERERERERECYGILWKRTIVEKIAEKPKKKEKAKQRLELLVIKENVNCISYWCIQCEPDCSMLLPGGSSRKPSAALWWRRCPQGAGPMFPGVRWSQRTSGPRSLFTVPLATLDDAYDRLVNKWASSRQDDDGVPIPKSCSLPSHANIRYRKNYTIWSNDYRSVIKTGKGRSICLFMHISYLSSIIFICPHSQLRSFIKLGAISRLKPAMSFNARGHHTTFIYTEHTVLL